MKRTIHSLAIAVTSLLSATLAQGQTLFESDYNTGYIYEFTPTGVGSTFGPRLWQPSGLAFDSAGNLFEADRYRGNIYEVTPNGGSSTFASGLREPAGLAFNSAGNLFEADFDSNNIYEFTPNGGSSTFASGLNGAEFLAFQPVPEPSTSALVGLAAIVLLGVLCGRIYRRSSTV